MKRKKKTERQLLEKACDDLVREILKIRSGGFSERSGKYYPECLGLQVSHFISRSNRRTRWDLDNVYYFGAGEHHFWADKHHEQYREWVKERLGEAKFDNLLIKARARGTYHISKLRLMKMWLQQKLEEIANE